MNTVHPATREKLTDDDDGNRPLNPSGFCSFLTVSLAPLSPSGCLVLDLVVDGGVLDLDVNIILLSIQVDDRLWAGKQ